LGTYVAATTSGLKDSLGRVRVRVRIRVRVRVRVRIRVRP